MARYINEYVSCLGHGWAICNAVRQAILVNPDKITKSVLWRVLYHMIQGMVSKTVYETLLANPSVCSLIEHDGPVTNREICWNHLYLELKRKH